MPEHSKRNATIKAIDMPDEWKQTAIDVANQALDQHEQEKDIAGYIKKEFDKLYKGTWHCVTGRNFGCFLTHEDGCFIYFYMGAFAILLFKSA